MLGYSFKRGQITRLCLRAGARLKYSSVGWRGKGQNKCYGITMDNVHSLTYTSRPLKKTTTTQPTPLPPRSDTTLPPIPVAPLSTLYARLFSLFFIPCPDSSLSFLRSSSFSRIRRRCRDRRRCHRRRRSGCRLSSLFRFSTLGSHAACTHGSVRVQFGSRICTYTRPAIGIYISATTSFATGQGEEGRGKKAKPRKEGERDARMPAERRGGCGEAEEEQ